MKRPIKFRGLSLDYEGWLYGDITHRTYPNEDGTEEVWTYINSIDRNEEVRRQKNNIFNTAINTDTIGQFTGLLDRNGKEIYEGDIVEIGFNEDGMTTKHKCVVRWNDLNAGFVLYPQGESEGPWYGWLLSNCIIVGNIYELSKS